MEKLYRFSPIYNEKGIEQALEYIVEQLEKLNEKVLKENLPITTIKLFAHYPEEYDYLFGIISKMGPRSKYSSNTSLYIDVDRKIGDQNIKLLGLRIVDPYRIQVGCGNWEIKNFASFKKRHLESSPFVRGMNRDADMLEVWHPDFEILGYAVPPLI